ncbi:ABC transporter permease [Alkalihalophilus lindianensis]|uniref:ABC transporter permease n=1 Tax=Alkalihalophilus lindianensis TaxID=1630542 RepID=A0ABU3X557_9BACI|nr:ABC transporter permease [Alkalihalophilus lindianensis]MDV2683029.1 ABC transporter permease [Alkalihalophilus lindianensis]
MVKKSLAPTLLLLLLLGMWEMIAALIAKPYLIPGPVAIFHKLIELNSTLMFIHLPATLEVVLIGLMISTVGGVSVAILMHRFKVVEKALYPLLVVSQTIPIIALAPIFVLWFGYSIWSKVFVTVLITFFPITVNTFDGLKSTPKELRELFLTMKASPVAMFFKLYVPSSMPSFLSGMKVAIPLSVVGAAIGEWLGAEAGLGYFSRRMMTQFDGPGVFAPIVWLSLIGMTGFLLITLLERYLLRWRNQHD